MDEDKLLSTPQKITGVLNYSTPVNGYTNGTGGILHRSRNNTSNNSNNAGTPSPARTTIDQQFSPYYTPGMSPSGLSDDIIRKQRKELQLLISELKDRDRELNDMLSSHKKQLLGWEEDRQRVLTLEQKLSTVQGELQNKREECKRVRSKLKIIQNEGQSNASALENTQEQLVKLSEQSSKKDLHLHDLEEKNISLSCTIQELNNTIGQLEAREQELLTMVKLKDKDLLDASGHITDLSSKLKKFDIQSRDVMKSEASARKAAAEWKNKYSDLKKEFENLKNEMLTLKTEKDSRDVEMEKLKMELSDLKIQSEHTCEREKRKDELIELGKSKQERTDSELSNLRMIYERQQKDIALLHLNLESSKELLARQRSTELCVSVTDSLLEETGRPLSEYTIRTSSPEPHPVGGSRSAVVFNEKNSFISSINHDDTREEELSFQTLEPDDLNIPSDTEATKPKTTRLSISSTREKSISMQSPVSEMKHSIKERFSPTSKLHRLLVESRQMVENLEKAASMSSSKQNSPRGPLSPNISVSSRNSGKKGNSSLTGSVEEKD